MTSSRFSNAGAARITMATASGMDTAKIFSDAAKRVAWWLLESNAQLREGTHAGAVAGTLDARGRPQYIYAEITGYFLQWLAWYARKTGPSPPGKKRLHGSAFELCVGTPLAVRAQAAQDWLGRWVADGLPRTRVHVIDPTVDDWRNRTLFTFDLAMVLRGIGAAADQGLLVPDRRLIERLNFYLSRLIAPDGMFNACLHVADTSLPRRWSTCRGGFMAKAAAGILHAEKAIAGIDPAVMEAAENTFKASLEWAIATPHREAHPLLYTYEGVLSLIDHEGVDAVLPQLITAFITLLGDVRHAGYIIETDGERCGAERVDVLAQALRIYDLLHHRIAWPSSVAQLIVHLRSRLAAAVHPDGGVPFALQGPSSEINAWAAMFASQALEGMDWSRIEDAGPAERSLETGTPRNGLKPGAPGDYLCDSMFLDPLLV